MGRMQKISRHFIGNSSPCEENCNFPIITWLPEHVFSTLFPMTKQRCFFRDRYQEGAMKKMEREHKWHKKITTKSLGPKSRVGGPKKWLFSAQFLPGVKLRGLTELRVLVLVVIGPNNENLVAVCYITFICLGIIRCFVYRTCRVLFSFKKSFSHLESLQVLKRLLSLLDFFSFLLEIAVKR